MFAVPNKQKVAIMDYEKSNDSKEDKEWRDEGKTDAEKKEEKRRYRKDYSDEEKALEEWDKAARAAEAGEVQENEDEPQGEEATWKKRYGDSRKFINELQASNRDLQKQIDELKSLASQKQEFEPPQDEAQLMAWAEKNPAIYNLIRGVAIREYKKGHSELQEGMENLKKAQEKVEAERAETILLKLHPDFETIRESSEFHKWMEDQPETWQDAIYNSYDVKAAARVLDMYKFDKGITKTEKKTTVKDVNDAARAVTPKGAPKTGGDGEPLFKESDIAKMRPSEYEANEDKILAAYRAGRVQMDVSGR